MTLNDTKNSLNPHGFPDEIRVNFAGFPHQFIVPAQGPMNGTARYANGFFFLTMQPHQIGEDDLKPTMILAEKMPDSISIVETIPGDEGEQPKEKIRVLNLLEDGGVPHRRDVNLMVGIYTLQTKKFRFKLVVSLNLKGFMFGDLIKERIEE